MDAKFPIVVPLIISIVFSLLGCSHTEIARTTAADPKCTTIVEGFFHAGTTYLGQTPNIKGPAISVKHGSRELTLYGDIVRRSDSGVVFWPKKVDLAYRADSTFYPYEQIVWLVDKDNKVVFGSLPKDDAPGKGIAWEMRLEMANRDEPKAEETIIVLKPNEWFSYCIDPGYYTVKKLLFSSGGNYQDQADPIPALTLQVDSNIVNYAGDMYLDARPDSLPNVHRITTNIINRPGNMGAMFGLIGALVSEALKGAPPVHTLSIEMDSTFKPSKQGRWKTSLLSYPDASAIRTTK